MLTKILLMFQVLVFDSAVFLFQSQVNQLNHIRETSLRVEKVVFYLCVGGFNSRIGLMVKVVNIFGPSN